MNPALGGLRANPFQVSGGNRHPANKGLRPPEHLAGHMGFQDERERERERGRERERERERNTEKRYREGGEVHPERGRTRRHAGSSLMRPGMGASQ